MQIGFKTQQKNCCVCGNFFILNDSPSFNYLDICSLDCYNKLIKTINKINIGKKNYNKLTKKPFFKTEKIRRKLAKKNKITLDILTYKIYQAKLIKMTNGGYEDVF